MPPLRRAAWALTTSVVVMTTWCEKVRVNYGGTIGIAALLLLVSALGRSSRIQ
jgi:hypothetical protein